MNCFCGSMASILQGANLGKELYVNVYQKLSELFPRQTHPSHSNQHCIRVLISPLLTNTCPTYILATSISSERGASSILTLALLVM